jgi:hypothetical protein
MEDNIITEKLTLRVALVCMTALSLAVRPSATVTFHMSRTRLAKSPTVGALRYRATLFGDSGKRSVWA